MVIAKQEGRRGGGGTKNAKMGSDSNGQTKSLKSLVFHLSYEKKVFVVVDHTHKSKLRRREVPDPIYQVLSSVCVCALINKGHLVGASKKGPEKQALTETGIFPPSPPPCAHMQS